MLNEVKFKDLNNRKKTETIKDTQRAAHSQGYTMSDPKPVDRQGSHFTVDLTHRKTGKKVSHPTQANIGGAKEKSGALDNTLRNRMTDAIKAHTREIGRQDKRPAAKAKRKAEAAANKKRKQNDRDPFKRGKKFEDFMTDCNRVLTEG